eukprot:1159926-Pelagomonas_calceolata.AAC.8
MQNRGTQEQAHAPSGFSFSPETLPKQHVARIVLLTGVSLHGQGHRQPHTHLGLQLLYLLQRHLCEPVPVSGVTGEGNGHIAPSIT